MSRLFGWDLPPGCSQADIDNALGCDEDETDAEYIARLEDEAKELEKKNAALKEQVEKLTKQVKRLKARKK